MVRKLKYIIVIVFISQMIYSQDNSIIVKKSDADSLWQDIHSWTNFEPAVYKAEVKANPIYLLYL